MPLIQVKLIENVFTPAQKKEIINRLTDAMVSIEGENMRQVTWVTIEEVRSGDWGIGGLGLTTRDVHHMMAGHNEENICYLDLDTIPFTV
jgi:4-oxalocrotonate tautomerase